ncbi:hypothetical protein U4I94_23050, partial [Stenotrophomonas maltophilia]|uniref:hypothetical protein n=1 Tax=Stenotrophomonas maltophilia TaxID=40324 RepID=UPI002ACD114D
MRGKLHSREPLIPHCLAEFFTTQRIEGLQCIEHRSALVVQLHQLQWDGAMWGNLPRSDLHSKR